MNIDDEVTNLARELSNGDRNQQFASAILFTVSGLLQDGEVHELERLASLAMSIAAQVLSRQN